MNNHYHLRNIDRKLYLNKFSGYCITKTRLRKIWFLLFLSYYSPNNVEVRLNLHKHFYIFEEK